LVISKNKVYKKTNSLRNQLLITARNSLEHSYDVYSQLKIGAAVMTTDDIIFSGCNIENISFGLTICAERVAIFKAISEGYRDFKALGISSKLNNPIFPCGACRQVLAEFAPNITIYVDGEHKSYCLSKLLPKKFNTKICT